MRTFDIVKFLTLVGSGEIVISDDEEWVRGRCPLAPFTHAKGRDENPSFGIKVNNEGESGYHCFTCGSGRLFDLIHIMNWTTGIRREARDFYGLREIFDEENKPDESSPIYYEDVYGNAKRSASINTPIPQEVIDRFPTLEKSTFPYERTKCIEAFESRGILKEAVFEYGVRHKPYDKTIAFPIHGIDKKIYAMHLLRRDEKFFWHLQPKHVGYSEETKWGSKGAMFGFTHYDPKKPLILVESETDLLMLVTLGVDSQYSILATCGPPTHEKISVLRSTIYYHGYDSDPTGSKYYIKTLRFLPDNAISYRLDWERVKVTDRNTGELRRAKDAGDLEDVSQVVEVLHNKRAAVLVPTIIKEYKDPWM